MRFALINPDRESVDPPLGLCYIAAYLRKHGFDNVAIIDKEDPASGIKRTKADVAGISAASSEFPKANLLAKKLKDEFGMPMLIGGVHISSMPRHLPQSNFDIGVIGEGEQTTLELMQLFEKEGSFPAEKLKKIKGIVFKNNDQLETTAPRPPIEPLDEIPHPARDLLDMKKHYLLPRKSFFPGKLVVTTGMITSRGCPYNCTFCSSSEFWQKKIRLNSAEYVVEEMKQLVNEYKIDHMEIWDDLFSVNKNRLRRMAELIKQEGLKDNINIVANGRSSLIDEEMCTLLKGINVVRMSLGLESGSPKILKYLKKGVVTVEDNYRAIKLLKQHGIQTNGFFIIGSPEEAEEDLEATLKLVKDENMDSFSVFQLAPFPGTEVWDYALKKGIVSDDINFDYEQLAIPTFKPKIVMTEKVSKERFEEWYKIFQEEGAKKYYKKIKFDWQHVRFLFSRKFLWRVITHPQEIINYIKYAK